MDFEGVWELCTKPWTRWVGIRYLKSKKNSQFLNFVTLLSIFGIGLGVSAMIVVLSVMDGFEAELKKRMIATDLHILIQPQPSAPGFVSGLVPQGVISAEMIEVWKKSAWGSSITGFWPVLSTEAILRSGKKVTGVFLKGVDESRLKVLESQMVESHASAWSEQESTHAPEVYLGQELASEMGLFAGDIVTLVSPTETDDSLGSVPRLRKVVIAGIYHSGLPDQELHVLFAKEQVVQSFLKKADVVSQWEIAVQDFEMAPKIAQKLKTLLPDFRIQDWVEMNANLFASLKLERIAMFVILSFIIVVASFNIVTTLSLMVFEKKREIAILKTMGAEKGQIAAVFLAQGGIIGSLGIVGGLLLGLLVCCLLKRYDLVTLPEIYYDRTLPVTFDAKYYLIVMLCTVGIVWVACLYPSKRASKLHPLEGIRFG